MKLIISILWLCSGFCWTMLAAREMNNVRYWMLAIFSFAACIAYKIVWESNVSSSGN